MSKELLERSLSSVVLFVANLLEFHSFSALGDILLRKGHRNVNGTGTLFHSKLYFNPLNIHELLIVTSARNTHGTDSKNEAMAPCVLRWPSPVLPSSSPSFAPVDDAQGAENKYYAASPSKAAATAYYNALDLFLRSASPQALEAAMVGLDASLVAEKDARTNDMYQVIQIKAHCDLLLEQKPDPDEWWALVGMSVEMEGAEAKLTGGCWEDERQARYADLLRAAQIKVDEGLLVDDPWLNMLWAEIVAHLDDDDHLR
jgi:hypothetical protein